MTKYNSPDWDNYPPQLIDALKTQTYATKEWNQILYDYYLTSDSKDKYQWYHLNTHVLSDHSKRKQAVSKQKRILLYRIRIKPKLLTALKRYEKTQTDPILIKTLKNFIENNDELIFNEVYATQAPGVERMIAPRAAEPFLKDGIGGKRARKDPPQIGWDPDGKLLFSMKIFNTLFKNATGGAITDLAAAETEAASGAAKNNLLNALAASNFPEAKLEAPEITRQDLLNKRQCLLFSDLLNGGQTTNMFPRNWNTNTTSGATAAATALGTNNRITPFHGRILPVTPDKFDSNLLVNYCTTSKAVKQYFNDLGKGKESLFSSLNWVYLDTDGSIKETEIYKSSQKRIDAGVETSNPLQYNFEEVDVKFEGTNPSTARDDVLVKLTIKIDSFKGLDAIVAKADLTDKSFIMIKVQDLITLPTLDTIERKTVAGSTTLISSYSPDYSRIRLKVWDDPNSLHALIIDLATIKHTMSRQNDATGGTTIEIEYRGYFEQALNMPYNDAFATKETRDIRKKNEEFLKTLKNENCSKDLIKKVTRGNQEFTKLSIQKMLENGSFLKRLFDAGVIYDYTLINKIETYLASEIDLSINYINGFRSSNAGQSVFQGRTEFERVAAGALGVEAFRVPGSINFSGIRTPIERYNDMREASKSSWRDPAGVIQPSLKARKIRQAIGVESDDVTERLAVFYSYFQHCIFLGDLMNIVVECLYDDSDPSKMAAGLEQMNLKFIVGTVKVPNPGALMNASPSTPPYLTINPLAIPIDLGFFIEWFHASYVKKGIGSYPTGMFIRDLIERLVNDILYESCFSVLLPDENPPQLRNTFFSDHTRMDTDPTKPKSFKTRNDGWFYPYDPFNDQPAASQTNLPREMLMQKRYNDKVETASNYCTIYQQFPSYFRQLRNSTNGKTLKDDPYTVTMYYGANFKNNNYCSDVTFTKTDSDFLREARYFNSAEGTLSLLSNVYDLEFSFDGIKANTYFYPGNIINFILTDWAGDANWKTTDALGESDPHVKGSKAYVLGFGGYFIIKSVNYRLSLKDGADHFKITISTKFLGTDVVSNGQTEAQGSGKIEDLNACLDVVNENAARVYTFIQDENLDIEPGVSFVAENDVLEENAIINKRHFEIVDDAKESNLIEIDKYLRAALDFSDRVEIPVPFVQPLIDAGYTTTAGGKPKYFIKGATGLDIEFDDGATGPWSN